MENKEQGLFEHRMKEKTNSILEILKEVSFNEIEWLFERVQSKIRESKGNLNFS